jgi:hypothetical protein
VSSYRVASDGTLALLQASVAQRGAPIESAVDSFVSSDGRFFYQEYAGLGVIGAYALDWDGTLTPVDDGDGGLGLPMEGAEGLAGF